MPSFTKKAIIESFLQIAGRKPLEKITVRDIVDDCGINRNTFYYYFQDIYAVLEEICADGLAKIPRGLPLPETIAAAFDVLSGFTLRYPRVMRQIAISVGIEGSERYFGAGLDAIFGECLTGAAEGRVCPPELARFIRHAFLGIFMTWLRSEDPEDPAGVARSLSDIGAVIATGLGLGKN